MCVFAAQRLQENAYSTPLGDCQSMLSVSVGNLVHG